MPNYFHKICYFVWVLSRFFCWWINPIWFLVCRTPFRSGECYSTLSRPFNTEEYSCDPFKTNSKGTCFQQTPCSKGPEGVCLIQVWLYYCASCGTFGMLVIPLQYYIMQLCYILILLHSMSECALLMHIQHTEWHVLPPPPPPTPNL